MQVILKWLWPTIVDHASARRAVMQGYVASGILSVLFFFTAFLALYTFKADGVDHRWDLLDAFVFMVVGWLIKGNSKAFAIVGTILCAFELWQRFSPIALPVFLLLLVMFVNSVRGAEALKRFPAPPAPSA